MPSVVEFDFVDSKSGKITYIPPSSYTAATGSANCQTGQNNATGAKWRAFFNFDTSSLPDNALVATVEFFICKSTGQPAGAPQYYILKFSIGSFIGAALNGNSGEFNGGTLMVTLSSKPDDNTWMGLDQDFNDPRAYVNLTGDTDIKVWDDSIRGTGDASWGLNFNTAKAKCKLRVTYTIPSATATGRGTANGSGAVTVAGKATASGRGVAQAFANVTSLGFATATGRGTSEAGASAAVFGSCVATGRGEAELLSTVVCFGVATVTGRGAAEIAVWIVVAGAATATGWGSASCDGRADQQTASATATGRGFAWCRLVAVYFDSLARHSGTRSVRIGSADARSVSRVHNARRVCATDEPALRGARRLN